MASDLTPESIRRASFRTVLRGLDAAEVQTFLEQVASRLTDLEQERKRLEAMVGDHAKRDLETEFDQLGQEVTAVLQAAREAAETMRERASLDAARWRSESMAEAERMRKEARNDAEALRGDAWSTGTELLRQAVAEAHRVEEEAQREVLTVMGSAERDASRLTSTARREAEDLVRTANMDAEKVTADATRRRDEMIEQAHRQASTAEERTRALEERRTDLLEELENVRATLTRLEGALEQRREGLNLSSTDTPSVKVVPSAVPPAIEDWVPGETVRIIHQDEDADGQKEESVASRKPDRADTEPEPPQPQWPFPAPEPESEPAAEPIDWTQPSKPSADAQPESPESEMASAVKAVPETTDADDDGKDEVGALFASLRGTATHPPESHSEPEPDPEPVPESQPDAPVADAIESMSEDFLEERDKRLLPIINRSLRGVKKSVTDAQNLALDGLRTDGDWVPEAKSLAEGLKADLIGLWTESFTQGHEVAVNLLGHKVKRPETPVTKAADEFGEDLAEAVSEALIAAGDGQRERQSAASRVFRGWRTQEAERRVRELAYQGYRAGMEETSAVAG